MVTRWVSVENDAHEANAAWSLADIKEYAIITEKCPCCHVKSSTIIWETESVKDHEPNKAHYP